jgi:thiol-disulfide isomerase/thioredoxin
MSELEGETSPSFELTTLSGEQIVLPLSRNHVLVFWATWCGPCGVELGRIQRLIKKGAT